MKLCSLVCVCVWKSSGERESESGEKEERGYG